MVPEAPVPHMPSTQDINSGEFRPIANFSPSIWGEQFIIGTSNNQINDEVVSEVEHEKLKEETRRLLTSTEDKLSQKISLIDLVERLGVFYHFTKEIDEALENIYHETHHHEDEDDDDDDDDDGDDDESKNLYVHALRFRLLRQHGYRVSSGVFNKYKDEEGNFKESIKQDVKGMLNLYEAAYLALPGEEILEQALVFTTTHLKNELAHISPPSLAQQVARALERPSHKCLQRVEARHFISIYQEDNSHSGTLLKFAKLDFNKLQAMHKKELGYFSQWWKDLNSGGKLSYVRDRIVELYFWTLGVYFEPQYDVARRFLTKVIALTSIIDDTYDAYGTFEELKLYTEAIERWDISAMDQLPGYMKISYKTLLETFDEIEEVTRKEGRPYCFQYTKQAMKETVEAYFIEAKWYHEGHMPAPEVHMPLVLKTSGYPMLAATSFVGMTEFGTEEAFKWLSSGPKILMAASLICRLMDDVAGHKFEQQRGHPPSTVECYMKAHPEVTEKEVRELFMKQVEDAWKDMNQECIIDKPNGVAMPIFTRILNLARAIDFLYKEEDGYTHYTKALTDSISALLVEPMFV